jgi:hypothetical protein
MVNATQIGAASYAVWPPRGFKSVSKAQRLLGAHAGASNLFNFGRRKFGAQRYREKLIYCPETVLASVMRQFICIL